MTQIQPLSMQRIQAWFDANEYNYQFEDGENPRLRTGFGDALFVISARGESGELLYCQTLWKPDVLLENEAELKEICNNWNSQRFFPKTYCDEYGGVLEVRGEFVLDLEPGCTETQIGQYMGWVISTGEAMCNFFDQEAGHLAIKSE